MLQASSLTTLPGIRHAFFTRSGGVSQGVYSSLNGGVGSGDAPEKVAENRARMAAALGVSADRLVTPFQIHSPDVVVAQVPRLAIGVSTADCGPLLFADSEAGVIGAAHAGWRGALSGVIEATVAAMERLGAERDRINVALGPTIRQQNYEVGPEFVERFQTADRTNANFFAPSQRDGHAMFDLTGYIAQRVERAGITRFEDLGLCTFAEPARFFSYRRTTLHGEPDYGRHVNAIVLA